MSRFRSTASSLSILGALAFGCAHSQAVAPVAAADTHPTPAPVVAPAPAPERSQNEDLEAMLRGDALHFDYDRADLSPDSQRRLRNVADILQSHPQLSVRIEGNCDERGTEDYNLQLGRQRAEAARRYLHNLGIEDSRVATISYGKDKPANPAHNAQAWAQNRRDEIDPTTRN